MRVLHLPGAGSFPTVMIEAEKTYVLYAFIQNFEGVVYQRGRDYLN